MSESDLASLKALLLTASDLPSAWAEDASYASVATTPEPSMSSCPEEVLPDELASVTGSQFIRGEYGLARLSTTAYLYSTPSEAQANLSAFDEYAPGMRFGQCFTEELELTISSPDAPAVVSILQVVNEEVEGFAAKSIGMVVRISNTNTMETISFNWVNTVSARGRVLTMTSVIMDDTSMANLADSMTPVYGTLSDRLLNSSLAA